LQGASEVKSSSFGQNNFSTASYQTEITKKGSHLSTPFAFRKSDSKWGKAKLQLLNMDVDEMY
jgi:hypothetical protein